MRIENITAIMYDPPFVTIGRIFARMFGGIKTQEWWGVCDRPPYAYGLMRAAIIAKYFGYKEITACEFGVAHGDGLLAMIDLADKVTAATDVKFKIVGFDTGIGLPKPDNYKDHPEVWSEGDFALVNINKLKQRLNNRAELII